MPSCSFSLTLLRCVLGAGGVVALLNLYLSCFFSCIFSYPMSTTLRCCCCIHSNPIQQKQSHSTLYVMKLCSTTLSSTCALACFMNAKTTLILPHPLWCVISAAKDCTLKSFDATGRLMQMDKHAHTSIKIRRGANSSMLCRSLLHQAMSRNMPYRRIPRAGSHVYYSWMYAPEVNAPAETWAEVFSQKQAAVPALYDGVRMPEGLVSVV